MKIENIKVNSYGALKEKEINLQNKINIIYGKNESGKSTILNFIKNTFYGISKKKNGKEMSDYEKYAPWNGEEFSGKIKYSLDNGKNYEVYRDFKKNDAKIYDNHLDDISNEFDIDKKEGSKFFYEQTKVDESMYTSSIMTAQQEVKLDSKDQNALLQRIANLAGTGEEDMSYQKVLARLNKRQVEEVGNNRTQDRPLNVVTSKLQKLKLDMESIASNEDTIERLKQQKEECIQNLEQEQEKNYILNKLNEITQKKETEMKKLNYKTEIKNESEKKLAKFLEEQNGLNKKLEELEKNKINFNTNNIDAENINNQKQYKKINKSIFITILIFLIIINICNFNFIKSTIINYLLFALIPAEFIIYIILKIKNNKINKKMEEELNKKISQIEYEEKVKKEKQEEKENYIKEEIIKINSQIKYIQEEIEKQIKEIETEKNNIEINFENEIEQIVYQHDENNINDEELIQISGANKYYIKENRTSNLIKDILNTHELEEKIKKSNNEIMEYKLQLNNIEINEKYLNEELEKVVDMQEEYINLEKELEKIEQNNNVIQLTKQLIEKAYEKMKNSITPQFAINLSNNMEQVSNGKYKNVNINDEKGIIVELGNGEYVSANKLSIGTIDQLYLSLRLSILEELTKEKMPIILDETFAYYDNERLESTLKFLAQKSDENQIIIFTCTEREKEILEKLNLQYNLIEL